MSACRFVVSLALAVLPLAHAADNAGDWSDAPVEWIDGLHRTAFCAPGMWTFDSRGEFTRVGDGLHSQLQGIDATAAFFRQEHKGHAVWSRDRPRGEDLTRFMILRDQAPGILMTGFIGEVVAVTRRFEHTTKQHLFWNSRDKAADCEGGRTPRIEINHYTDSWSGGSEVTRASLALAGDGALLVRIDYYSCWLCLFKNRTRTYARFPPPTTAAPPGDQLEPR